MWPGFWFTQVLDRWSGARTPRQPEAPSWGSLVLGLCKVMPAPLGQPVPRGSLSCEVPGRRGTQMSSWELHPQPPSLWLPYPLPASLRMLQPGLRRPSTFLLWPLLTLLLSGSPGHPHSFPGRLFLLAGSTWWCPCDPHVCEQDSRAWLGTIQEEPGAQQPCASHHAFGWGSRQDRAGPARCCPSEQTEQAGSRWFCSPDNTDACHYETAVLWNIQNGQIHGSLETPSRWVVAHGWGSGGEWEWWQIRTGFQRVMPKISKIGLF